MLPGPFNATLPRAIGLLAIFCLGFGSSAVLAQQASPSVSSASATPRSILALGELSDIAADLWPLTSERDLRQRRAAIRDALAAARGRIEGAHRSTMERTVAWQSLPPQPDIEQVLSSNIPDNESVSTGDPSEGELHHAVKLPVEGPHHAVIEGHRKRETNYGTEEIVELLRHAAASVARRHPGSVLRVGNISRQSGGDIRWSGSHNSGRDADVAFFAESVETGRDVVTPDLVSFGRFGRSSSGKLRFDVARNWSLVRAMLTFEGAELQWLFISQPLKAKLLARAHRLEEPAWLIRRARKVLHQPTAAPPHADHLHIRIACPASDRLLGCQEYGPQWSWHDTHRRPLLARTLALVDAVDKVASQKRQAIWDTLGKLGSPYATEFALRRALKLVRDTGCAHCRKSQSPRVEHAVTFTARHGEVSTTALVLAGELLDESSAIMSAKTRTQLYGIVRRGLLYDPAPGPDRPTLGRRRLLRQLADRAVPSDERKLAAKYLAARPEPAFVPVLIDELDRQPNDVRDAITWTLRLWTGRSFEGDSSKSPVDQKIEDWRRWWRSAQSESRERWIDRAFKRHGYPTANHVSLSAGDTLLRVLQNRGDPDWLRILAARRIEDLTGRHLPTHWDLERQANYWSNWWPNNRARLYGEETARELKSALPDPKPPQPRAVARRALR